MNRTKNVSLAAFLQPRNDQKIANGWPDAKKLRHSVYLPLNHNDGSMIEFSKLEQAVFALIEFSQGATCNPPGLGWWINWKEDKLYQDNIVVIDVMVSNSPEAEMFVMQWMIETARLLEQEENFVVSQPVWPIQTDTLIGNGFDFDFGHLIEQLAG